MFVVWEVRVGKMKKAKSSNCQSYIIFYKVSIKGKFLTNIFLKIVNCFYFLLVSLLQAFHKFVFLLSIFLVILCINHCFVSLLFLIDVFKCLVIHVSRFLIIVFSDTFSIQFFPFSSVFVQSSMSYIFIRLQIISFHANSSLRNSFFQFWLYFCDIKISCKYSSFRLPFVQDLNLSLAFF